MWDKILLGFDSEDQTANFGTRSVAETNGSVFEATTVASIQAGEEVTKHPQLQAKTYEWGGVCLSVDASVTIFKDQSCSKVLLHVTFDSAIESFQTSKDGLYLFIAVQGPEIHCVHIPSGGTHVFSSVLLEDEDDVRIVQIFCESLIDETVHLTLVCSNGQTLRCPNLNLMRISSALSRSSTDELKVLRESIFFVPIASEVVCSSVTAIDVCCKDYESVIAFGGKGIGIKSDFSMPADLYVESSSLENIKIIRIIKDELFILALTSDGALLKICAITLIQLQSWTDLVVEDFIAMPQSAEKDNDILLLTQSDTNQHSWLLLMSALTFEVKLRLEVPSRSCLVLLTSDQQEIMYLQCSGEKFPDTIHLKTLVECAPIDRFNRLLRRNKFEEAERYAQVFNLNMDEVCKGQAKGYVGQLCPWSRKQNASDAELTMSNLLTALEKITDDCFVCELCITAAVPDINHVRQLLRYAKKRLSSSKDQKISALASKVNALECRLETCEIVNESSEFDTWVLFSKINLLEECKRFLSMGELHRASVIWSRHFSEIKCFLTPRITLSLLRSISHGTPVRALMRWLRQFVPTVMSNMPEIFEDILLWILHIIKSMTSRQDWPECGFQCAQEVLDLLKVGKEKDLNLNLFNQYSTPDSALQQFISLIKAVTHLKTLKDNYHITKVPLDIFMSDDKSYAVQMLLENVSIMRFGQFASCFLEKYAEEWDLDMDMIIYKYIESKVLPNNKEQSDYAPWEFLVATLLSYVKNLEQLLGGIILALKAAPVPWSDTIEKLAERGLAFNHPFAHKISQQKNLVTLKLVLKKYNIKHNVHDEFDDILTLMYIKHIIKRNLPGMLEDCLTLSGEDEILEVNTYFYVFDHLIKQGNEEKAFKMLDSLEPKPKILYGCLRKIIFTCSEFWDWKLGLGKYSEILTVIKNRLDRIDKRCGEMDHYLPVAYHSINELINLQRLYDKVHIYMTTSDYRSELHRRTMLQSHITTRLNIGDKAPHCEPGELAMLLKLPPEEGILESMKRATDYGFTDKAVAISTPLKSLDTMSLSIELKMRDVMKQMMASCKSSEHVAVAQMVGEVAVNACRLSNSSVLEDWVTLWEWSRKVTSLSNSWTQTRGNIDDKVTQVVDLHKDWKLSPIFFDRSVFADKSSAMVLVKYIYMANEEELTKQIVETVTAKLHRENNDLTGLSIIRSLYHHTSLSTKMLDSLWNNAAHKLLLKVLLSRKFDSDLGLALLFSLPHHEAHGWLKDMTDKYHHSIKHIESISTLAISFYHRYYCYEEYEKFSRLHLRCVWAKRMMKLGVDAKEAFNISHTPQQVLNVLMHIKQVHFCVIEEFCKAFDFDVNDHMLPLIKILILSWEPEVHQSESPEGLTTYKILNNEAQVVQQCKAIIDKFKPCNRGMIFEMLESLMSKVNFYFYETYLVLYELMESVAPKTSTGKDRSLALNFLRKYNRVCQPGRIEVEMWEDAFPDSKKLPMLSKWRLPFQQFLSKDVWSIVKLEVNIDSYETWLRAAPIIGLDKNSVCSVAIRHSIKQVTSASSSGQWSLYEKEPFLLSQIQRCINKFTDPKNASAALFHVINNTPPGADLYALTKLCFSHATTWRQVDSSEFVEQCYEKAKKKYLDVATSHILYSYGLGLPHYLERITHPKDLIIALYNDPSIVARGRNVAVHYPDINEAVEKLADLHSLKLIKILIILLEEFITSKSTKTEWSDETFTEMTFSPTANETLDDEHRLQACYILHSNTDIANKFLPYLVTFAYNNRVEEYPSKLQALRCLFAVTREARLEKLTGRKIPAIRMFMQSLHYVVELARFRIVYTVPEFEACAKLELVKMICQLYGRNQSAMKLIIQLCYDFSVFHPETWDFVLNQLVNLKMDSTLEEHLPRLAEHSSILITAGYIKAWHYLLQIPFHQKDAPLTAGQVELCLQKLRLLESCPIVCSLELLQIVDQLLAVGCPHLAAIILPMMTNNLREISLKKLLEKHNAAFIFETLLKPDYDDFLTVQKAIKIVKLRESQL